MPGVRSEDERVTVDRFPREAEEQRHSPGWAESAQASQVLARPLGLGCAWDPGQQVQDRRVG